MLSIYDLLEIACRYNTAMAEAMTAACLMALGVTMAVAGREQPTPPPTCSVPDGDEPDLEWDRMVRENTDTRYFHT